MRSSSRSADQASDVAPGHARFWRGPAAFWSYGDLSANSGLNALRDEDYAREFLARYQDKLMFGSDCDDRVGEGAACSGARCLAAIRRLAPNNKITEKILHANAARVLKIRVV